MPDCKHPSASGFWITVVLVAVLVGYPLSIGPAFWVYEHTGMQPAVAEAMHYLYSPLIWLSEQSEVSENLLLVYVSIWKDGF